MSRMYLALGCLSVTAYGFCYNFNILTKIRLNCKSYLKIVAKSE